MAHSDSEGETIDDLEFETRSTDAEGEEDADIDEDILDALEGGVEEASEADDDSPSEDSDDDGDEDDEDDEEETSPPLPLDAESSGPPSSTLGPVPPSNKSERATSRSSQIEGSHTPKTRKRSISPAQVRKRTLLSSVTSKAYLPRSYTVEAICAIPHPVPTHALASSFCMSHLLTGSDDGYIRDYDMFSAVNGKVTLTAPQRHHCGVVEGNMKAGQIRYWWENPDLPNYSGGVPVANEPSLSPVYSLAMHSDALWSIAGTNRGHINMFTVRHEPGRLFYVIPNAHRGPISALSLDHNEKGLFSAGWDGEAIQWDLNTGQLVRKFTVHGAQLVNIAVRPLGTPYYGISPTSSAEPDGAPYSYHDAGYSFPSGQNDSEAPQEKSIAPDILPEGVSDSAETAQPSNATTVRQAATSDPQNQDADSKSDASFDPLFDDEPDADGEPDNDSVKLEGSVARDQLPQKDSTMNPASVPPNSNITGANPVNNLHPPSQTMGRTSTVSAAPPKNAPPAFDPSMSATFSPDILMTAAINGQILLWDRRVNSAGQGVGRLWNHEAPPWCVSACWSTDGSQIYIGRRKATLDVWDIRQLGRSGPAGTPRLLKTLRNPPSSGAVSCVVPFPDGRHIACASSDNIRLWNAAEAGESEGIGKSKSGVQFKIIPGHHGGFVSQMVVDPGARFLVSASSNRGWHGESTRTVFVHDIKAVQ